jgi:hypothetical protein
MHNEYTTELALVYLGPAWILLEEQSIVLFYTAKIDLKV